MFSVYLNVTRTEHYIYSRQSGHVSLNIKHWTFKTNTDINNIYMNNVQLIWKGPFHKMILFKQPYWEYVPFTSYNRFLWQAYQFLFWQFSANTMPLVKSNAAHFSPIYVSRRLGLSAGLSPSYHISVNKTNIFRTNKEYYSTGCVLL